MFQILFLSFLFVNGVISKSNDICPLVPNIINSRNKIDDYNLYFFISFYEDAFYENSIDIINQNGELVECISIDQFKHDNNLNITIYAFYTIFQINENLYAIAFVEEKTAETIHECNHLWLFTDANIKIRNDLGILKMGPHIESKIFSADNYMDAHDIYVNDEMTHAIVIIAQTTLITNVKEYYPNALIDSFTLLAQGLCAIDLKTGKETSAISPDGFFLDYDEWYNYIKYNSQKYFTPDSDTDMNYDIEEILELDFVHITSMKNINGSHFSSKVNKKLFLTYAKNIAVTYLFDWNYKQNQNNEVDIIWILPSKVSPDVIKREWMHKWEYIGDPFQGTSNAHDANIRNLPKGHILYHDNGQQHFISNSIGHNRPCPITRIVEYKIEMDYEREGYHRITLVFSYPKVSEYADLVVNDFNYNANNCIKTWDKYNYQKIVGNVDKIEDKYIMTYYSYYTLNVVNIDRYYSHKMLMVDSNGEIVNHWGSNDATVSYKISPIDLNSFRNGLYSIADDYYEF